MGCLYRYNQKFCCTCQFWQGPRIIKPANDYVDVKSSLDEGICCNPKAILKGKKTKANYSSCIRHEKWEKLK